MSDRQDSHQSEVIESSTPKRMVHLKTKEECRLGNETIKVWTVELPSKHAEAILKVIKDNVEGQAAVDLQHLRRFAKPRYLPAHVLGERDLVKEMYAVSRAWESTPPTVMQAGYASWEWTAPSRRRGDHHRDTRPQTLYMLICPSNTIPLRDLHDLLLQHPPFCSSADSWAYPLEIKEVKVPVLAPTSPEQAQEWSEIYWPTFYRKTNPFGAHPTSIANAETELQEGAATNVTVADMLKLADEAGAATEKLCYGIRTGCVIVERVDDKTEVVAVAGDARLKPLPSESSNDESIDDSMTTDTSGDKPKGAFAKKTARKNKKKAEKKVEQKIAKAREEAACSSGNVMAHAVMRAIGMVGRKRLRVASTIVSKAAEKAESNFAAVGLVHDKQARDAFFLDLPINPLEQEYFQRDNLKPDGYLCLKLEIFLTHEPCVMCSMALVHSRVGRVIFEHRMPKTGGLTAEMVRNDSGPVGLGYGLCWRKELNWQFMCWEYTAAEHAIRESEKEKERVRLMNGNELSGDTDDDHDDSTYPSSSSSDKKQTYLHGAASNTHDDVNANLGMLSFASIHV